MAAFSICPQTASFIPRRLKSAPAQLCNQLPLSTVFTRCSLSVNGNEAEALLPLKLPLFVTLESVGRPYQGLQPDLYFRPRDSNDVEAQHCPYPVGYRAVKRFKGSLYEQTIVEGEDGPLFQVTCNAGTFQGRTPEEAWEAAGTAGGMSQKYSRSNAFQFFGLDNSQVQRLIQPLIPLHVKAAELTEAAVDKIVEEEDIVEPIRKKQSPVRRRLAEAKEGVAETGHDSKVLVLEAATNASMKAQADLMEKLLRLRPKNVPVPKSRTLAASSWAVHSSLLLLPSNPSFYPVLGTQAASKWSDDDSRSFGEADVPGSSSISRFAHFLAPELARSPQHSPPPIGNSNGEIMDLGEENRNRWGLKESGKNVPQGDGVKGDTEQMAEGHSSESLLKTQSPESLWQTEEGADRLRQAAALTAVHVCVQRRGGGLSTLRGALLAVVAGKKTPLVAVVCEDNVFRLLPGGAVRLAANDEEEELNLRRPLEAAVQAVAGRRSAGESRLIVGLLPPKQSWKAVNRGTGFHAPGADASLPLARALQLLPPPPRF